MIKKQTIIDLIETHFEGSDKFIVDIKIRTGNIIEIFIDAPNHILIADCVELIEATFEKVLIAPVAERYAPEPLMVNKTAPSGNISKSLI